ncbi:unnamed protein product [Bathycoccus prasinos]
MSAKLMDATPDLKRLAPVENLAIDVISYAHGSVTPTLTNLYTKGKDSFLKGSINTIEGLITSYGTPVISTVQKTYPKVVTNVDKKVDGVLTAVQSVWENRVKASYPAKAVTSVSTAIQTQREQFPENIAYLKSLTTKEKREDYLKFIELKIQELQSATKEVPQLAYDAIKTAIQNAREKLDSFELLKKVDELWQATLNLKQVKTVVKAKEDLSQKVHEKATEVSNNAYVKKATKSVNEVVQTVQSKVKGTPTPKESRVEEMD